MNLNDDQKVVFIAMSKHYFFFRRHAVKYVLDQGCTPISQFGIFDYFITDGVDRDSVRKANNNLIRKADEMWVFGPISDGVLAEVKIFRDKMPIRYFDIIDSKEVKEITKNEVQFEEGLEKYADHL